MTSNQWSVTVTAPVPAGLDIDAQAVVAEKLRATITHDGARHLLTADYRVTARTLRLATDEALRAARTARETHAPACACTRRLDG